MNISKQLKALEFKHPEYKNYRYFDCDGDPYKCDVFLVGLNPAFGLPNGKEFWDYWSETSGFELSRWKVDYQTEREKIKKTKISPTRNRIETLRATLQPHKLLNCNIFSKNSPRLKDLKQYDMDTEIFCALLRELSPKYIILHGGLTKKVFEKIVPVYSSEHPDWQTQPIQLNGEEIKVLSVPHLFNMALTHSKNEQRNIELVAKTILGT